MFLQRISENMINKNFVDKVNNKADKEEMDQLSSQLEQIPNKINLFRKITKEVSFPIGFSWDNVPVKVLKNGIAEVLTGFDATDFKYKGSGKTYHVSLENGDDSNDGLTKESALKSIYVARSKPDVTTIVVYSGYYEDLNGFNNKETDNKSINIIAAEGADVTISTRRRLQWIKTPDFSNVYQADRTVVASVYDGGVLDKEGDFTKLKQVSSISEVDNESGTYYYNNNILYVHTVDGRPADDNVYVFLDVKNYFNEGNHHTYMEGIKLHGGSAGCVQQVASGLDSSLFVAKNCEFKYSSGGNGGLEILGSDAIFQNCTAAQNFADGFNYHSYKGRIPKAIEINCVGRHNGVGRGTSQDNGSTMHDGGKIIRINGEYFKNEGPNVHDINAGTESWNIGCASHDSIATASHRNTDYRSEQGAKMWIEDSVGFGSNDSVTNNEGEVFVKNTIFEGNITGDIIQY